MKAVIEHYAQTGEVMGKGTDDLEGYTIPGMGYFGPGQLPEFDADFFNIPQGRREEYVVEQLRDLIKIGGLEQVPKKLAQTFGRQIVRLVGRPADCIKELYFTPEVEGTLPPRGYFQDEPEFEEDL